MIVTHDQITLAHWLSKRIGLTHTPDMRCIGNVLSHRLIGVVGYDNFNGSSIMMHSAGEGNWLTKEMLFSVFDYPFRICRVNMVIGLVPSGNTDAIRFNKHIGFSVATVLEGAHPDGALLVMTMLRGECRFLDRNRKHHGQKVEAATAA